jgi:hypothetical protein
MLADFIRLFLGLKRAVREAKKARRPNLRRIRPAEYILSDSGHWRLGNPEEYLSESGVWRLASQAPHAIVGARELSRSSLPGR